MCGFPREGAAAPGLIPRPVARDSEQEQVSAGGRRGAVIALTAVEKPVKDPNSETQSVDRNTLVDAVKHSGKVQI